MSNTQYRNNQDVRSLQGVEVEAGSLWDYYPKIELLILVDEDQHLTADFDAQMFAPAE